MYELSRDECRAFLLEGTRAAKLVTTRKDGRPHVAPIWFLRRLPWSRSLPGKTEYGARNGVEGELLVRVTPTKVLARAGSAD